MMKPQTSVLLLLFCVQACLAQQPETIEHGLAREGIGTSHEDLMKALHSPKQYIRTAAALQLASKGDEQALPAILDLAERAHDEHERLGLAQALQLLHHPYGETMEEDLCVDSSVRPDTRLEAAMKLQEKNERCVDAIAGFLAQREDPVISKASLDFLAGSGSVRHESPELYTKVLSGLKQMLSDQYPDVRQAAANGIAKMQLTEAGPALQQAHRKEIDPDVRAAMKAAEDALPPT